MAKTGIINIIGGIGSDMFAEVSLRSVMEQVAAAGEVDDYLVNINSGGGEVSEGYAIYNYLLSLNKPITTRGVGLVASIATVIFLAGKKRELYNSTQFLIHNPWTYGEGDADVLTKRAEELRLIENQLLDFYVAQTGSDKEVLQSLMREDKIITADAAQELKFATIIIEPIKAFATYTNKKTKSEMSKIGRIFKDAFKALQENGVILNDVITTADGTELEIEMVGSVIAVGDSVNLMGAPADGTFTLGDGTIIEVASGVITAVTAPTAAEASIENATKKAMEMQIAELTAEIENLKNENAALQTEKVAMEAEVETITNHLRSLKVTAKIPAAATSFASKAPVSTDAEPSKDEIKARFKELQAKSKSKITLAI